MQHVSCWFPQGLSVTKLQPRSTKYQGNITVDGQLHPDVEELTKRVLAFVKRVLSVLEVDFYAFLGPISRGVSARVIERCLETAYEIVPLGGVVQDMCEVVMGCLVIVQFAFSGYIGPKRRF